MRRWRDLHTWIGLCAAAFFLVTGGTGALLALGSWLDVPPPEVPAELRRPPVALDAALAAATAQGGEVVAVDLSRRPDEPWRVQLTELREVWLAPGGEVLEIRSTEGNRLMIAAFYLHTGQIAGRAGETFMTLVGLSLTAMVGTGVLIWPWLVRRQTRARRRGPMD